MRCEMIGSSSIGSTTSHVHICQGIVLNLCPVVSQTQTNGSLEAVGNQDVRLVIKTETHLWSVIQSRHSHLGSHSNTHLCNSSFGSGLSLLCCHTLSHEATQHTLDHRVLHCVCNV